MHSPPTSHGRVDEAAGVVFEADRPPGRPEDMHDILGTFEVVDDDEMRRTPGTAAEYEQHQADARALSILPAP